VGTSFGFGERSDPIAGENVNFPGVGNYNIGNEAELNENPKWR